jgi:ribosomal protein S18 acetylase RimI-like enzyme
VVLAWVPDAPALRLWAGPRPVHPINPAALWTVIDGHADTTYVLATSAGEIAAFGQILRKEGNRAHLARLIVSPAVRRQGYGRALCLALMRRARQIQVPLESFSLNVYPENTVALHLYRSLGFTACGQGEAGVRMQAAPTG